MPCDRGAKGPDGTTNPAGEQMRVDLLSVFLAIAAGVGFVPRLALRQWPGGPGASEGDRGILILRSRKVLSHLLHPVQRTVEVEHSLLVERCVMEQKTVTRTENGRCGRKYVAE